MEELHLLLIRVKLYPSCTEGVLINKNNNEILFDTLEDVIRDINADGDLLDRGEGKVYGKTAIPYTKEGEYYDLEATYSPKFKMDMVLVKNVPHFTGIRLHWGRTVNNTEGCILGGKKINIGVLDNIGFTKYMVDLLNEYGGKATLEII